MAIVFAAIAWRHDDRGPAAVAAEPAAL